MAAPKHQYPGDRFDRPSGFHLDFGSLPPDLAASADSLAARSGDHPRGEQFRNRSDAARLWDRTGNLGLSAIRNDIRGYRKRAAKTELSLLTSALGPSVAETDILALLARFGNTARLLAAPTSEIAEILHDRDCADKLKSILQIAAEMAKPEQIDHPVIGNCVELVEYLQAAMGENRVETFRILFLDAHNKLIADETLWRGTISEVQVYPREVMRRALELDSSAFIAAHNHPSNIVIPSQADIEMTKQLLRAATALGIGFHDHFIISTGSYHSMRFHRSIDPWGAD
jgi:DNA repair protein RadC